MCTQKICAVGKKTSYPEKFHLHIHAIVTDGLSRKIGKFYVMPDVDLKPLEEIFCAKVFKILKEEGKIDDDFRPFVLSR